MTWLVVLLYAIWSSVFVFGKAVLEFSTPLFLTGARMLVAAALMLAYLAIRDRSQFRIDGRKWLSIGALALFSIYLTNILEFWGLQYLSAAKTCFIYSLSPFFSALFSYIHFNERMSRAKWIGMLIGFLGMIPVLVTQTGAEELFTAFGLFTLPTLAIVGAALFSVYGWVILRLIVKDSTISPVMANGSSMAIGGIMALISSYFIDGWTPSLPIAQGSAAPFALGLAGMTLLYNIICYNLYGFLLKRVTATFLSFMGLLSPIFASLIGWLFLGELPSWQIFVSTGFVSIGLFIVYRAELKQGYIVSRSKSASPDSSKI